MLHGAIYLDLVTAWIAGAIVDWLGCADLAETTIPVSTVQYLEEARIVSFCTGVAHSPSAGGFDGRQTAATGFRVWRMNEGAADSNGEGQEDDWQGAEKQFLGLHFGFSFEVSAGPHAGPRVRGSALTMVSP